MSINHEVKGNLARLLATEDLVVEHRKASTASFNTSTRVLTLPLWDMASEGVYDLLVAHEVGHALYTENQKWKDVIGVPKTFVNITEDVRIEKLMKRRYNGLYRIFNDGYFELYKNNFFGIDDGDILSTYNLADRINIHFKIGKFINVEFAEDEIPIVAAVEAAETLEDAIEAAKLIYQHCKEELKFLKPLNQHCENFEIISTESNNEYSDSNLEIENSETSETSETSGTAGNPIEEFNEESLDNSSNDDISSSKSVNSDESNKDVDLEPKVHTSEYLNDTLQKLNNMDSLESSYVEIPDINLDNIIVSNQTIHSELDEWFSKYSFDEFNPADFQYSTFKSSVRSEVNYLVKEFECKKSADSYSRALSSRTGILDTKLLHSYIYNDDLFKKVTTISDGKNHGLIFLLDWSGSMDKTILNVVKQMFNLVWFCSKVGIPFEVYAFSDASRGPALRSYEICEGYLSIYPDIKLLNILSSKCNRSTLNHHMRNVYRMALWINERGYLNYNIPPQYTLSGTPLNESIAVLHKLIPNFNKIYNTQKLHCVILSYGEGNHIGWHKEFSRNKKYDEKYMNSNQPSESTTYMGISSFNINTFIRIRKTGMTYKTVDGGRSLTNVLIKTVKDSYPNVNIIGIRLVESGNLTQFIRNTFNIYDIKSKLNEFKKNRSILIPNSQYSKYFAIPSNDLSTTYVFSNTILNNKSSILSAFKKSLNIKKTNKKFLNEFIELIA